MSRDHWISVNKEESRSDFLVRIWSKEPKPNANGRYLYGKNELNCKDDLVVSMNVDERPSVIPDPGTHAKLLSEVGVLARCVVSAECESRQHAAENLQRQIADLAIQYAGNDNMMPGEEFFKLVKQYRQVKDSAK